MILFFYCIFLQEIYSIEDLFAYVTDVSNWQDVTNKGNNYKFSPFTLPTNHRIEIKLNSTNAIRIACGDATHTNSGGWLEWIYAWYLENSYKAIYYRNSNNEERSQGTSSSTSTSTSVIYAIEYNGTNLQTFIDSTRIFNLTSYDTLSLTRLIRLNTASGTLADNLDWIKVKPL